MITEAIVKAVKYPPECIPDSWFGNVPALSWCVPGVLELRRFSPFIIALTNIQLVANANVAIRLVYDNIRLEGENTAAMLSAFPGAWTNPAKETLHFNFMGLAPVANYTTHYGLWVIRPTIAHKLFYGIPLANNEKAIAEELGISNSVEKGILPLPIGYQIEREYYVAGEETHSRSITIAVANTDYTLESIYPRTDEFVVLTRIAANPGLAAQDIRLVIDRDDDAGYAELRTFPLSLVPGGEVACFIPALREIRLTTRAAVAPGAHLFRYTFQRVRLTNLLKVRFGLVTEDEVPKDLFQKVIGGIL